MKKNEEFSVNLKVKVEEKNVTPIPPEENKPGTDITPEENKPAEDNNFTQPNNKPGIGLPNAGGRNTALIIMGALILIISGRLIYKNKGKKSTTALLLAFIFSMSLVTSNSVIAYADDSSIKEDSDSDELSDYDEIKLYNTNPNDEDSDSDGLSDSDEIELGTDPNNADSNGNGIKDGDESFDTSITLEEYEKDENVNLVISGNIKGEYIDDIVITNMEGAHSFITEDIPGYIGAPFRVGIYEQDAEQEVTLTFSVEQDLIDQYGRIGLYEFDKEEMTLKEVEPLTRSLNTNEIVINTKLINEYREYVILMAEIWEEAWNKEILDPNTEFSEMDIVLTIDSSGSMSWNDENDLRKSGSIKLINKLEGNNRAAIVDFDSYAVIRQDLTTDKDQLINAINMIDSYGGTDISRGLAKAINALDINSRSVLTEESINIFYSNEVEETSLEEDQGTSLENEIDDIEIATLLNTDDESATRDRYIMLLTDGQSTVRENDPSLVYAREDGIKIFTIGLGSDVEEDTLRMIASTTGGKYLFATSADDLEALFDELTTQTIDLYTDSDGDGIPNYFERNLRLINGVILQLDPNNPDTDGDGLSDGFEICGVDGSRDSFFSQYDAEKKGFNFNTRPDIEESIGNILDVTGELLLKAAELSYENTTNMVGKKVSKIKEYKESSLGDPMKFGTIILQRGEKIIVSFTGSAPIPGGGDGGIGDIAFDWGSHLAAVIGFQYSHAKSTEKVIDKIVKDYSGSEVYITGHSLGGYLAQKGAYYMNKKENYYNKSLKATMTFNTEPIIYARYLDDDLFGSDNDDIESYGYRGNNERYIHNYHMDGDFLYKYAITKFNRKVAGGSKKVFPVIDDELSSFERHSLSNFYPYVSELNYDN